MLEKRLPLHAGSDQIEETTMKIFDLISVSDKQYWIDAIGACDWAAARFLAQLLREDRFCEALGTDGKLFLLTDSDALVGFATLTHRDCVADESLYPWIGFVFTNPQYRGKGCAGRVLDHACEAARQQGHQQVYLATDHVGFYERYGFVYLQTRTDIYNEQSRIYRRKL